MNLAAFDLNLLTALEALLAERHVSRAAARIGVSQPTMSQALRRLREAVGDPLFHRTAAGMVPTATALELGRTLQPCLAQIRAAFEAVEGFDPATTTREFTLGCSDAGSFAALPMLARTLRATAPRARLNLVQVGTEDAFDKLMAGAAELAVGLFEGEHPDFIRQPVFEIDSMVVADRGNPRIRDGALSLTDFLAAPHLVFTADPGRPSDLDRALAARGLRRNIAMSVSHYLAIPGAVLGTDLIAVVATQGEAIGELETLYRHDPNLIYLPVPLPLPRREASVMWRRRYDDDPGHAWLRGLILRPPPSLP